MAVFRRMWILALVVAVVTLSSSLTATAADPAFVGKLALAADPQVAKEIGLSDEVRSQLIALIDKRETDAVELLGEVKDLPEDQKKAKMAESAANPKNRASSC